MCCVEFVTRLVKTYYDIDGVREAWEGIVAITSPGGAKQTIQGADREIAPGHRPVDEMEKVLAQCPVFVASLAPSGSPFPTSPTLTVRWLSHPQVASLGIPT
jgi:hypothetical protein